MSRKPSTTAPATDEPRPRASPDDGERHLPVGSQAEYARFIRLVRDLPDDEVIAMRADLSLVIQNVRKGVASVLGQRGRLVALPETDVPALELLERMVLSVMFADTQINKLSDQEVGGLLDRARLVRSQLLKTAEGLAAHDLLPTVAVRKIRAGTGAIDTARDCVELAALFTAHDPVIRGKHPVTVALLAEAQEVGTQLLQVLRRGRARHLSAAAEQAIAERDRLWTLVVRTHESLWRAGAYLFGRELVEQRVPSLQANRGGRRRKPRPAPASVAGLPTAAPH